MSDAHLLEYVRRVDPGAIEEYEDRTLHRATRATVIDVDEPEGIMTVLGPVYAVTYTGTLQGDTHLYEHEFKGDARPTLMVDANNRLHMVGGDYHVADVGIVDGPGERSTRRKNPAKKQPKITFEAYPYSSIAKHGEAEYDVIAGGEPVGILRGVKLGGGAGIEWQAEGVTGHTAPDEYDTIAEIPDSANTNTAKKMVRDAYKKMDLASIVKKVDEHHRTNPKRKPRLGSGGRFADCVDKMRRKPGVYDPEGLCASIGRKKYGAKKMARMAKAGRRRRRNPEMSDDQLEMMAKALGEYEQRAGISEAERLKARALKGELRKSKRSAPVNLPQDDRSRVKRMTSADADRADWELKQFQDGIRGYQREIERMISRVTLNDLNEAYDSTDDVYNRLSNVQRMLQDSYSADLVDNFGPYVTDIFLEAIEDLYGATESGEQAWQEITSMVDDGIESPDRVQEIMEGQVVPYLEEADAYFDQARSTVSEARRLIMDVHQGTARSNPGHRQAYADLAWAESFTPSEHDALAHYRRWFRTMEGFGWPNWAQRLSMDLRTGSSHYNGPWPLLRQIAQKYGDPADWPVDPTSITPHSRLARDRNPHSPTRNVTGRLPRGSRVANSGSLAVPQSMPNWTQDWPRVNSGALTIQQPRIYPGDLPSVVNGAAGLLGPNVCRTVPGEPIARQVNPARKQMGKWRRQKFQGQTLYLWDDDQHTATIAPYKPRPRSKAAKPQNYAKMIRSAAADYETQHGSKLPKGTKYLLIISTRSGSGLQVTGHKSYASAKRAAKKTLR